MAQNSIMIHSHLIQGHSCEDINATGKSILSTISKLTGILPIIIIKTDILVIILASMADQLGAVEPVETLFYFAPIR